MGKRAYQQLFRYAHTVFGHGVKDRWTQSHLTNKRNQRFYNCFCYLEEDFNLFRLFSAFLWGISKDLKIVFGAVLLRDLGAHSW